eukprot:759579-Hanusia_phi.AAC.3
MLRLFGRRPKPEPHGYVACLKDNSLVSYLHEAFKLLELRFKTYDKDGAETLMFYELERQLSLAGFADHEKLEHLFNRVDLDKNGTLDFGEFLCLLYLWVDKGDYSHFFQVPQNAMIVSQSFAFMERAMIKYDKDKSRALCISELNSFFKDHLPEAFQSGTYQQIVDLVYPVSSRQAGKELSFPKFMILLYEIMCRHPGTKLDGFFSKLGSHSEYVVDAAMDHHSKEHSRLWISLEQAFHYLEEDFNRFDTNGDMLVDFVEITQGIPLTCQGTDKVSILSRLEYAYKQVDFDRSGTLDFYEFVYMSFMMTQNGSYHELVEHSQGSQIVKKSFIDIHTFYRKYDTDGNLRLTYDELEKFCNDLFGEIPAEVPSLFAKVSYQSTATQGRKAVDVVRFMKLLYMLIKPNGRFHPDRYNPTKQPASKNNNIISMPMAIHSTRPSRFQNIAPAKFKRQKLLGKGGQGEVYMGQYETVLCAGKTLIGDIDENAVRETKAEVDFFMRLDHPNCHYLLGAKTSIENGGILLLTELCELGSVYDFYGKSRKAFDAPTALRLAHECSTGFSVIHQMGFMHRDIKSLNVFLTSEFIAKVADFGMCTNAPFASEACGTPQWMAPEVIANVLGKATMYDHSIDVYSYGVLLWELFHCSTPYADTRLDQMGICKSVFYHDISQSPPAPVDLVSLAMQDRR